MFKTPHDADYSFSFSVWMLFCWFSLYITSSCITHGWSLLLSSMRVCWEEQPMWTPSISSVRRYVNLIQTISFRLTCISQWCLKHFLMLFLDRLLSVRESLPWLQQVSGTVWESLCLQLPPSPFTIISALYEWMIMCVCET